MEDGEGLASSKFQVAGLVTDLSVRNTVKAEASAGGLQVPGYKFQVTVAGLLTVASAEVGYSFQV